MVPGFYSPISGYSTSPNPSYYESLSLPTTSTAGPSGLATKHARSRRTRNFPVGAVIPGLESRRMGWQTVDHPSPAHSDSDASNSSLELGSIRRGENAQLKCRWQNCGRWFTSLEQLAGHVGATSCCAGTTWSFLLWLGRVCQRRERGFNARYKIAGRTFERQHERETASTVSNATKASAERKT